MSLEIQIMIISFADSKLFLKKVFNFYNEDLFDLNLKNYNVIYTSNLCFNEDTNERLTTKLSKELQNGSYIFASKPLKDSNLKFQKQIEVEMTWNKNHLLNMYIKQS